MKESEYKQLCQVCDQTLLGNNSNESRVAIPWLHIIREHSIFLSKYEDIFNDVEIQYSIRFIIIDILSSLKEWIIFATRNLRIKALPWFTVQKLSTPINALFVSHLLSQEHIGTKNDFYFGPVPHDLIAKGFSTAVVYINHIGIFRPSILNKWIDDKVPRMVLSSQLKFISELCSFLSLAMESICLFKEAKESSGLQQRILLKASKEALNENSRRILRISKQIEMLVDKLQPKAIIVTYEGHSFERLIFSGVRKSNPNVICIGYQHSAIFRLQHAIKRKLKAQYNPDYIFTSGNIGKDQLESCSDMNGIPILVFGSDRITKSNDKASARDKRGKSCLVIPEYMLSECNILFEFSLECAKMASDINFIWRLHPTISFEEIVAKNPKLALLPNNIRLSQSSLADDIASSDWALYRGSTAIVQAVAVGLRPIYLEEKEEMTIDPLHELPFKDNVNTVENCIGLIRSEKSGNDKKINNFRSLENTKYCERFFTPFDTENSFLKVLS